MTLNTEICTKMINMIFMVTTIQPTLPTIITTAAIQIDSNDSITQDFILVFLIGKTHIASITGILTIVVSAE
jgi:hypothetical protein